MAPKSNISVALHAETRGNKTYIKLKYGKVTPSKSFRAKCCKFLVQRTCLGKI